MHRNGALNFIDKIPANFLYYKFIKLALPSSSLFVYRNEWDNTISLFKANYQDTIIYSSSFLDLQQSIRIIHLIPFGSSSNGLLIFLMKILLNTDELIKIYGNIKLKGKFSSEKRKSLCEYGR